jgi:hypothetical protein
MAEIDPLIAEILLKGDDEFLTSLKRVGEEGAENFEKLAEAQKNNASAAELLTKGLGYIEAALAGAIAATVVFVEHQIELAQNTLLLADAFGITGDKLQDLEAIFAESGVKVEQFERFAIRLTGTIAREWPQIAESIRTYANENDASMLRVQNASLRVQDAQNRLADNSAARASQMAKDTTSLEQAYIKVQFAAQNAASEQRASALSVSGAQLGEIAAMQRLAELQGRPVSEADKKELEIAQAQQAVDQARKATQDALLQQQEKAAEASLKQAQARQAYDDLARKAAEHARDDASQRQKDENAVKEAIIARGEADEKALHFAQTNIASIRGALDGIVSGNKAAAGQINLTEVSVENLKKGVIALAAETSKATVPTGFEALRTIHKLLAADIEKTINPQQRLRLVTELSGSSMQSFNHTAAELLDVMQKDGHEFDELADKAESLGGKIDDKRKVIEDFKGALASLQNTVSKLSQAFAEAIAPALTVFLKAIGDSLKNNDGYLHNFISGLGGLATAIGALAGAFASALDVVAKFINYINGNNLTTGWDILKLTIIAIGAYLVALTGPIGIIITLVGAAVLAVGVLRDNWKEVTEWVEKHKLAVELVGIAITAIVALFAPWTLAIGAIGAGVVLLVEHWNDVKKAILDAWDALKGFFGLSSKSKSTSSTDDSSSKPRISGAVEGYGDDGQPLSRANGGPIDGPGTTTSDSILARLSRGEFVQRAAAVQFWGTDFMHAINNMTFPGFAAGGDTDTGTYNGAATDWAKGAGGDYQSGKDWDKGRGGDYGTLNLSIDGRSFGGLKGPKKTIDDLSSFAIARQTSAIGDNPSWMK